MAENIIALIFPEYREAGNQVSSKDWTTDELYDDETIGMQIKEAGSFVDFFSDEECRMVYDSKNMEAYLYAVKTLPECYPSRASQVRSIFKSYGLKDWRRYRTSSEKDEYNINYETVKDEIRTEIAARQISSSVDSIIITTKVFGDVPKVWNLERNNTKTTIECIPMSILQVFDWLSKHHKPVREYEWNPKHGEFGKGAHPDNKGKEVSVLLSSRDHAKDLLPKAIGEPMYDWLYCFDADYDKYMEYPAGCKYVNLPSDVAERRYHSYHINDERQVPKRVVKKIKIIQNLSAKQ